MRLRNNTILPNLKRKAMAPVKMIRYKDTKYLVSEEGDIFNGNTGRKLILCKRGDYLKSSLSHNGENIQRSVHRIVAELFIPNPENKPQVNHKNGVKTDNRVINLEWATTSENVIHAHKTGLRQIGNGLWNGKFSREDIIKIKQMKSDGVKQRDIAKQMDCSEKVISHIIVGRNYKYYNV